MVEMVKVFGMRKSIQSRTLGIDGRDTSLLGREHPKDPIINSNIDYYVTHEVCTFKLCNILVSFVFRSSYVGLTYR